MTIYASQSAIRFSSTPIDVIATRPISHGAILVYDSNKGAFVTRVSTKPYIGDAVNLGGANQYGLYAGKNNGTLEFKSLKAGDGISLSQDSESITITVDINSYLLSVPEDYKITIDNDNDNASAKFEVQTATSVTVSDLNIPSPVVLQGETVTVGNDSNTSRGYFQSTTADFVAVGYLDGQFLYVTGTDEQDGEYVIDEVTTDFIYLTSLFTGSAALDLGTNNSVDLIGYDLRVEEPESRPAPYDDTLPYVLQSFSIDFSQHFSQGMVLDISNTKGGTFDGSYEIAQVTPLASGPFNYSELLMEPTTPFPESGILLETDPNTPQITLEVDATVVPTGFWVDTSGKLTASSAEINGSVTADSLTVSGSSSLAGINGDNLTLTGDANVTNLVATSDVQGSTLNISGDGDITGALTADSLTLGGNSPALSGDIRATDIEATGDMSTTNLNATDKVTAATAEFTGSIPTAQGTPSNPTDLTTVNYVNTNTVTVDNVKGAAQLPVGSTGERPVSPNRGQIRFNTDINGVEVYDGTEWLKISVFN